MQNQVICIFNRLKVDNCSDDPYVPGCNFELDLRGSLIFVLKVF